MACHDNLTYQVFLHPDYLNKMTYQFFIIYMHYLGITVILLVHYFAGMQWLFPLTRGLHLGLNTTLVPHSLLPTPICSLEYVLRPMTIFYGSLLPLGCLQEQLSIIATKSRQLIDHLAGYISSSVISASIYLIFFPFSTFILFFFTLTILCLQPRVQLSIHQGWENSIQDPWMFISAILFLSEP